MLDFQALLTMLTAVFFALSIGSCAGRNLETEEASLREATGNYKLLLFGCKYPDDILNAAFLDKEGDAYDFEIFAPDFQYDTVNTLPASGAFARADQFVRCHVHYQQTQVRKILDLQRNVVGYEVRPLYSPIRFGMLDVMIINYTVKENRIIVYIRLDPTVEAEIINQGNDRSRHGQ